MMSTVGAWTTSLPFLRTSSAIVIPTRRASAESKPAARPIGAGMAVALPSRVPTGPSE